MIVVNTSTSSVQKGESLSDTVKILTSYGDMIVVKQGEVDAVKVATWCGMKPFISAGDPVGIHLVINMTSGRVVYIWSLPFDTLYAKLSVVSRRVKMWCSPCRTCLRSGTSSAR